MCRLIYFLLQYRYPSAPPSPTLFDQYLHSASQQYCLTRSGLRFFEGATVYTVLYVQNIGILQINCFMRICMNPQVTIIEYIWSFLKFWRYRVYLWCTQFAIFFPQCFASLYLIFEKVIKDSFVLVLCGEYVTSWTITHLITLWSAQSHYIRYVYA